MTIPKNETSNLLGVVNSLQRRAGSMMNGTWNIANRILLLRVSQTLIPQVRLSAFGGPHDAPCRRFHVPSADHIENVFRHDAPCRRFQPTSASRATPRLRRVTHRRGGTPTMFLCSRSLPLSLPTSLPPYALILFLKKEKKKINHF